MAPNIKFTPHYKLQIVKEMVRNGDWASTKTVNQSIIALGLIPDEAIPTAIEDLTMHHFSKSVEDTRFHGEWQDAYKAPYDGYDIYIKLSMRRIGGDTILLLSFKEDEL